MFGIWYIKYKINMIVLKRNEKGKVYGIYYHEKRRLLFDRK